jgi:hypothetical protein
MTKHHEGASAYPLSWPEGWPRTKVRQQSRFDVSFDKARQQLQWEVERMAGRYPLLSTNLPLRMDGHPYSERTQVDDPGVALYFERYGRQMVFACDRWTLIRDNVRAIHKTIEALRGIERWGASDMMERALHAFIALPPPLQWWQILGLPRATTAEDVLAKHRDLAMRWHPDREGGSAVRMAEVNAARDAALKELSSST